MSKNNGLQGLEDMFTIGPDLSDLPEDRTPLNTKSMLEEGFLERLGGVNIPSSASSEKPLSTGEIKLEGIATEDMLLTLYDVRDGLIDAISGSSADSESSKNIASQINKLGQCIKKMGGKVDSFDLLSNLSGLQSPNFVKNAEQVIEVTRQCYRLGEVVSADIKRNGKVIQICFAGNKGKTYYRATGMISAPQGWKGNEAIDYIYTPGEGRMSVKSFENSKWVDKSSSYELAWELKEALDPNDFNVGEKKEGKVNNKKEELSQEDVDLNFPIEEKKEG